MPVDIACILQTVGMMSANDIIIECVRQRTTLIELISSTLVVLDKHAEDCQQQANYRAHPNRVEICTLCRQRDILQKGLQNAGEW